MRTVVLAALVAAAALFVPATAGATPFVIGEGHKPGVAVDPAGTAYIAWYGPESLSTTLRFCRLARGATTCAGQAVIDTAGGDSLNRPFVTVAGARVQIAQYRYGYTDGEFSRVVLAASTDGGNSFGAPAFVGPPAPGAFDEAVAGPGDSISTVTYATTGGGLFSNLSAAGGPANLFADRPYSGAVGLLADGRVVAVFADGGSQAAFRVYGGAGDLNDAGSWGPATTIGYADYTKLAGGRTGLFLLHGTETGGLMVRRWDGTTFPAGTTIGPGDDAQAHLAQDPAGRLHAVFSRIDAAGFNLMHAVSDDGVNWDTGSLALQSDDVAAQPRVAAAADHVGVAVWESRAAGVAQIRASALGPGAPGVPQPVYGKTVVIRPISGTVKVRPRGSSRFVDLKEVDGIPLGSTVDAKRGRLALSSVPSRTAAAAETVQLYSGRFKVTQAGGITQFALDEPLASCRGARAAAKKPKSRKLWGDGKGRFRTKGAYSAATVRGTRWLVQDSCAGTLTRVTQGSVAVRDFKRRKTVVVRAGRSYTARR